MKLYYSPGACSLSVRISLHEAGLPAEFERVDLNSKITESGYDYSAINPKGYVPMLVLDDGNAVTENVAILALLADRDPELTPGGPLGRTRLVEILSSRQALSIPQLMYLGDACIQLGATAKARELYQQVLTAVDKDESAKASAGNAVMGIRARFARILRSEGKLEEAEKQINALIKERPSALEPLIEKGYILQSLAERDPKRYDECISHWTNLRLGLQRLKTRPAEYYDVIYNTAFCLVRQSKASGDKAKAAQAQQILRSTLTLTPALNGPEMVTKYDALLTQAAAQQGTPAATPQNNGKR